MKVSAILALGFAGFPSALAWGGFGHITIAYIASDFVAPPTAAYLQSLLRDESADYLASVATWADSVRYTKWGRFTGPFHYIDAKDRPPLSCGVDLARDCKPEGCVVTALANYTSRLLGRAVGGGDDDRGRSGAAARLRLPPWERAQAAKFVVHLVADVHQPLHDEDVSRGGNGIHVRFDGAEVNLHHVWDTRIPEKAAGGVGRRRPYPEARRWASELAGSIVDGKFARVRDSWLAGLNVSDANGTALLWAREGNAYVCSTVLPDGPEAIVGQELGSHYYEKAAPVVELQIARAGYRLAAWLDVIVSTILDRELGENDEL